MGLQELEQFTVSRQNHSRLTFEHHPVCLQTTLEGIEFQILSNGVGEYLDCIGLAFTTSNARGSLGFSSDNRSLFVDFGANFQVDLRTFGAFPIRLPFPLCLHTGIYTFSYLGWEVSPFYPEVNDF